MTEQERRDLAHRLAEGSNVFDFERALELVQRRPAKAEKLLHRRRETARRQEERAHAREQLREALREEFG